MSEPRVG